MLFSEDKWTREESTVRTNATEHEAVSYLSMPEAYCLCVTLQFQVILGRIEADIQLSPDWSAEHEAT